MDKKRHNFTIVINSNFKLSVRHDCSIKGVAARSGRNHMDDGYKVKIKERAVKSG